MSARIGVVTFPGTLDDVDAARAVRLAGAEPVPLWHGDPDLAGVDALILPGGFSYGDYLRAGAIASLAPVMRSVVEAAGRGLPILGICNGFQVLCEAHLLPGALMRNEGQRFMCREQELEVVNAGTAWTSDLVLGSRVTIPLKNAEGRFVAAPEEIERIEGEGQVVLRYAGVNPNGSTNDIAAVSDATGRIVGLMPHPEHAIEAGFGPDSERAVRGGTDGLRMFTSVIETLVGV